jgi:hypothetical protein
MKQGISGGITGKNISENREFSLIQCLLAFAIRHFHDILSLDPGDRWARRLYDEIDRCDLFMLFWSRAAGRSEWVAKEI